MGKGEGGHGKTHRCQGEINRQSGPARRRWHAVFVCRAAPAPVTGKRTRSVRGRLRRIEYKKSDTLVRYKWYESVQRWLKNRRELLVLFTIVHSADAVRDTTGQALSFTTLQGRTGLGRATVGRALNTLEEMRLVTRERDARQGPHRTNSYRLPIKRLPAAATPWRATPNGAPSRWARTRASTDARVSPTPQPWTRGRWLPGLQSGVTCGDSRWDRCCSPPLEMMPLAFPTPRLRSNRPFRPAP